MKLLKIGMFNTPENRWLDALSVFEEITVMRMFEEKEVDRIAVIQIRFSFFENVIRFFLNRSKKFKLLNPISKLLLSTLRLFSKNKLKAVREVDYDEVHVSYNDFDESSLLFLLSKPYLKKDVRVTRAYKEMRNNYDYLEKLSFLYSDRVVFTNKYSQSFIEKKYGNIFIDKEVLYNLDEDYRQSTLFNSIEYAQKYSALDKKIHAVILAGRVLSNPNDKRSGSRLYYIDLINKLLDSNIVVHLQAKKIEPFEGNNPYEDLANKNSSFTIEHDIDFSRDQLESYKLLSRYDIGILHAHHNSASSYEFDKINIPNRYYEYELAHVVPVEIYNSNIIMEEKAKEKHMVCVDLFSDLSLDDLKKIVWEKKTFKYYIETLYGNASKEI